MNKLKLKYFLFSLIIGILIITELTACVSRKNLTSSKSTLDVKHIVMWKFKSNKEDYMIYELIKQWNAEHPDVQVKLELIPYTDYLTTRLAAAFATNSGPDVYLISMGSFLKYASSGFMLPLDDYLSDDIKNDFNELNLEAATYNGKIMGIPIEREPVALFYNKAAFDKKGLLPPKSWKELEKCVSILDSKKMSGIYLPLLPSDYQNFIFYSFLVQAGGNVINTDTHTSKFDTYGAKALGFWRDLSKYSYKSETSIQSPSDIAPLTTEKTAIQVCGYWAIKTLEKYYSNFDYGVVPLPYPESGNNTSVYGGWYQIVNPYSKYTKESVEFTKWMWADDASRSIQWYTEASTKFPTRKSVMEVFDRFSSSETKMFKEDILRNASPEPRYPAEISNIVSGSIQQAMFTDKDINKIAESANDEIIMYFNSNK